MFDVSVRTLPSRLLVLLLWSRVAFFLRLGEANNKGVGLLLPLSESQ